MLIDLLPKVYSSSKVERDMRRKGGNGMLQKFRLREGFFIQGKDSADGGE